MTMQNEDMEEMVVEEAILTIKKLKGVLEVQKLSDGDRETILFMESRREGNVVPVVNEGLKECLKRDFCLALLKNENFRSATVPTVLLITDKGRILGRELFSPEEKERYQYRGDVYFLSEDFVLFKPNKALDRALNEKEFFVLPPVPFPELEGLDEVSEVISCSPSAMGDAYLKNEYGYPQDPLIASIIVGFSINK
jgi:hypothetical protein